MHWAMKTKPDPMIESGQQAQPTSNAGDRGKYYRNYSVLYVNLVSALSHQCMKSHNLLIRPYKQHHIYSLGLNGVLGPHQMLAEGYVWFEAHLNIELPENPPYRHLSGLMPPTHLG
jgi:hypothetical protein